MIVGISMDSPKANRRFGKLFKLNFPLLSDSDRSISEAYGAAKPGSRGGADRIGLIVDPGGNVLRYYGTVSATGFPEQALGDLPED